MARLDSPNGSSAQQLRVFIVANDRDARHALAERLESVGCEIVAESSAVEASATAVEAPPDVDSQASRSTAPDRGDPLPDFGGDFTLDEIERRHILAVLARTSKIEEAAHILGINVSTLWRKRKRYEAS
jgi:DNA-binding NtrC family response regulator